MQQNDGFDFCDIAHVKVEFIVLQIVFYIFTIRLEKVLKSYKFGLFCFAQKHYVTFGVPTL